MVSPPNRYSSFLSLDSLDTGNGGAINNLAALDSFAEPQAEQSPVLNDKFSCKDVSVITD